MSHNEKWIVVESIILLAMYGLSVTTMLLDFAKLDASRVVGLVVVITVASARLGILGFGQRHTRVR